METVALTMKQEEELRSVAKWELHKYLLRYVAWMGFYVRRAIRAGVYIAISSEVYYTSEGAHVDLTLRLQETGLDGKKTRWWMETRAKIAEKLIEFVRRKLEGEGIKVAVNKTVSVVQPTIAGSRGDVAPEYIKVSASFRITGVDALKLFSPRTATFRRVHETGRKAGGEWATNLKALEVETVEEYERGGEVAPSEEDLRAATEGGGEEEPSAAGPNLIGPGEAAERGYLRLSRAVLKYNVPLYVLVRLVLDGRIEAVHGVDEKGAPAVYVKEEEVREVAKYIRLEEKESVEGGENGG